ncbi:PQ-loop domain-containing transporter [Oceanobacillus sp. FSL H7-0719]|uniref:PQ-loop domain-containing transporter n=1 Tax=Oceanobacillus sp. FSL H7-0719 TaxID=2954507 RepID=UPI00324BB036
MENFLLNHIATLATFFLVVAYIPQVIHTFKTKDVTGISQSFWILISIALGCLLINATYLLITTGVYGYFITELFNFSLSTAMLIMTLKYKKKGESK